MSYAEFMAYMINEDLPGDIDNKVALHLGIKPDSLAGQGDGMAWTF
jgi:hypothetical protein